jgi:hypothetical protein
MAISSFINLEGEDTLVEPKALLTQKAIKASIIALYNELDNKESNANEPQVIKLNEALDALERLKLYKGQQEGGNEALIATLTKAERVIRGRRAVQAK